MPTAVLSNKPHALRRLVAGRLGLSSHFRDMRDSVRERDKKPSRTQARHIVRRLGTEPCDVLAMGDAPVQIPAARRAGMIAVAVP